MDLGFLTDKLGPLPMWTYIGGAVAALLLYDAHKNKSATTTTTGINTTIDPATGQPYGVGVDPTTGMPTPNVTLIQEGFPSYSNGTNGPATSVIPTPPVVPPVITKKPPVVVKKPPVIAKKPAPRPVPHAAPRIVTVGTWNASNPWNTTLSGIAQHYYGNASEYMKIATANHITNPNLIYPGQRLVIP